MNRETKISIHNIQIQREGGETVSGLKILNGREVSLSKG